MVLSEKLNISLIEVVKSAGITLKRSGNKYIGLCPFHQEKTASFFVFDNNRYKCFGCGESGDVINFVQKIYNLSFVGALKHLGLSGRKHSGRRNIGISSVYRPKKLLKHIAKKRNDWVTRYCIYVSDMLHVTKRLMHRGIKPDDLDFYASLISAISTWEYQREILIHGDDNAIDGLYGEFQKFYKMNLSLDRDTYQGYREKFAIKRGITKDVLQKCIGETNDRCRN